MAQARTTPNLPLWDGRSLSRRANPPAPLLRSVDSSSRWAFPYCYLRCNWFDSGFTPRCRLAPSSQGMRLSPPPCCSLPETEQRGARRGRLAFPPAPGSYRPASECCRRPAPWAIKRDLGYVALLAVDDGLEGGVTCLRSAPFPFHRTGRKWCQANPVPRI